MAAYNLQQRLSIGREKDVNKQKLCVKTDPTLRQIVTHAAGIPAKLRKVSRRWHWPDLHNNKIRNTKEEKTLLPCFLQTGEHLRQSQAECRRLEGDLALSQLALNTAAAAASSAQAQIVAEQQAASLREEDTSRQLQSSNEALVRPQSTQCALIVWEREWSLFLKVTLNPFLNLQEDHRITDATYLPLFLRQKGLFGDDLGKRKSKKIVA